MGVGSHIVGPQFAGLCKGAVLVNLIAALIAHQRAEALVGTLLVDNHGLGRSIAAADENIFHIACRTQVEGQGRAGIQPGADLAPVLFLALVVRLCILRNGVLHTGYIRNQTRCGAGDGNHPADTLFVRQERQDLVVFHHQRALITIENAAGYFVVGKLKHPSVSKL